MTTPREMIEQEYTKMVKEGATRIELSDFNIASERVIEMLTRERDEYKRLYDFRGRVLLRPCIKCGYAPKCIQAVMPFEFNELESRKIVAEIERIKLLEERDTLKALLREAKSWIVDEPLAVNGSPRERIDAALKEEGK